MAVGVCVGDYLLAVLRVSCALLKSGGIKAIVVSNKRGDGVFCS